MKITVTMELNDENEVAGLTQFMKEVEAYRNPAAAMRAAAAQEAGVAPDVQQPETKEMHAELAQDPSVVGTITPEVKGPKEAELNQAALKFVEKHSMDKALEILRKYGVAKMPDLKDPAKRAELYKEFLEGAK